MSFPFDNTRTAEAHNRIMYKIQSNASRFDCISIHCDDNEHSYNDYNSWIKRISEVLNGDYLREKFKIFHRGSVSSLDSDYDVDMYLTEEQQIHELIHDLYPSCQYYNIESDMSFLSEVIDQVIVPLMTDTNFKEHTETSFW